MKIICIGRNYAEHIEELDGRRDIPSAPVFFCKPDTALLRNNDPFYVPAFSREVHYETELVVRIGRVARAIDERFAPRCYDEVGLGIDFTARDLQRDCIARGLPWEICKGFDYSAAVSPQFVPLAELGGDVQRLRFEMRLNGELRQRGDTAQMIFGVDRIVCLPLAFHHAEDRRSDFHRHACRRRSGPSGRPLAGMARGTDDVRLRYQMTGCGRLCPGRLRFPADRSRSETRFANGENGAGGGRTRRSTD